MPFLPSSDDNNLLSAEEQISVSRHLPVIELPFISAPFIFNVNQLLEKLVMPKPSVSMHPPFQKFSTINGLLVLHECPKTLKFAFKHFPTVLPTIF